MKYRDLIKLVQDDGWQLTGRPAAIASSGILPSGVQ